MIKILDYGLGNTGALSNMYKRMNIACQIAQTPDDLATASKLILPGVGAFDHAMKQLQDSGMLRTLDRMVFSERVPLLGICVGMQMLADRSDEGSLPGLGWIPGRVAAFRSNPKCDNMPLPHMGWNDVRPRAEHPLFIGLAQDSRFYFLHSFYFQCEAPPHVAATSEYGLEFGCAVSKDNIHGVQFHPEKSHHYGARLLRNFSEM